MPKLFSEGAEYDFKNPKEPSPKNENIPSVFHGL